jgi:hypothetical protein
MYAASLSRVRDVVNRALTRGRREAGGLTVEGDYEVTIDGDWKLTSAR